MVFFRRRKTPSSSTRRCFIAVRRVVFDFILPTIMMAAGCVMFRMVRRDRRLLKAADLVVAV